MSTNAPPCAACGYGLRWVPESNGWGCDRCRQFYPASAPAQPQQTAPVAAASPSQVQQAATYPQHGQQGQQGQPGYAQQPGYGQQGYAQQPAYGAPAVGGKKSNLGLILGIGGVAVVGGIIAIVLLTRGKGGGGGGGSDRDAVIKSAFTAMADGDADALAKLQPDEDESKYMDCDKDRDKDRDDDKIERKKKKAREKLEKLASKAKGAKIEIDEILTKKMGPLPEKDKDADDDDDDKPRRKRKHKDDDDADDDSMVLMRKGDKQGKGCKAKVDARMQNVKVRIKVTKAGEDKERTKTVKVSVVEIDGGYYIGDLPEIDGGGGKDKGDKAGTGDMDDILDAMEGFKDKTCACKDKKCADDIQKDYMDYLMKMSKEHKADEKPDDEAMKRFMEIDKQREECRKKLRSSGADDYIKKYETLVDKVCACSGDKAQECSKAAMDDYAKTMSPNDKPDADAMADFAKKSEPLTKKLTECMTRIATEATKAAQTPDTPPSGGSAAAVPADYAAPPADMPTECVAIRDAMAKIESCSKVATPTMHDGYKKSWDAYVKMWQGANAAGRKSISDTCAKTAAALKSSVDAACKQ